MSFIKLSIDVTKIDKAKLYVGKKGTYLSAVLYENDQPDQFDNTHVIKEDLTQEERAAGVKAKIIGNGKTIGTKRAATSQRPPPPRKPTDPDLDSPEEELVPFWP